MIQNLSQKHSGTGKRSQHTSFPLRHPPSQTIPGHASNDRHGHIADTSPQAPSSSFCKQNKASKCRYISRPFRLEPSKIDHRCFRSFLFFLHEACFALDSNPSLGLFEGTESIRWEGLIPQQGKAYASDSIEASHFSKNSAGLPSKQFEK